mmetsp:Transcript_14003/g.24818  ORF Transcript_14003/g.24818 Transcript_14003/m.24818 type:complete len:226 (+) Transcript_14003:455-1132(+)
MSNANITHIRRALSVLITATIRVSSTPTLQMKNPAPMDFHATFKQVGRHASGSAGRLSILKIMRGAVMAQSRRPLSSTITPSAAVTAIATVISTIAHLAARVPSDGSGWRPVALSVNNPTTPVARWPSPKPPMKMFRMRIWGNCSTMHGTMMLHIPMVSGHPHTPCFTTYIFLLHISPLELKARTRLYSMIWSSMRRSRQFQAPTSIGVRLLQNRMELRRRWMRL